MIRCKVAQGIVKVVRTNSTLIMNRAICRRSGRSRLNVLVRNWKHLWRLHEFCLCLLSYLISVLLPTNMTSTASIIMSCIHLLIQACIIIHWRMMMSTLHLRNCISWQARILLDW
ncbi:hypothetical protein BDR06DRAFT_355512 [Suillus hirtellus]|nr:hypothetical protein BDR06DRAFT_355512 [Suillus hirtellus]